MAIAGAVICAIARPRRGFLAFGSVLATALLIVSFWVNPQLNDARSGAAFAARIEQAADPRHELGLVAFKEQYVLTARREIVHFGHARWREADQEMADAALWLSGKTRATARHQRRSARRRASATRRCSRSERRIAATWYLVREGADPSCVARGKPARCALLLAAGTRRHAAEQLSERVEARRLHQVRIES